MAISVLVAVGDAADHLLPLIEERMRSIRVGDGMDPDSDMGPLVTAEHHQRVTGYLDEGLASGARLAVDGRGVEVRNARRGYFLGPCLFDDVQPHMSIYRDEIFGPVLSVVRVSGYDDALELIDSNPYANGVALFTRDGGLAREFQSRVQVGMVGINVPIPVPMAYFSFGGWRGSMFGASHAHGADGVRFYTRGKVVTARWPAPALHGMNLGFPTVA